MEEMAIPSASKEEDDVQDPVVDPRHPKIISFQDITSAAFKIKSEVVCTPCDRSRLSDLLGIEIYLKKENLQYTGSIKERGASYALMMLSDEKKKKGIVAASSGNHAQALSYHGHQLGIPVTIVVPITTPIMTIHRCQTMHAKVVVQGNDVGQSKDVGLKLAKANGMTYISSYDHPHVIAGQGSVGLEILEQLPDVDAIVIPCGGGGLIAGVGLAAKTVKPDIKIIGVESENCASFTKSLEAGKPVYVNLESTLADGLAAPFIGYNSFATAKSYVDKMAVVKESSIAMAILRLTEIDKCVVEGAGAASIAAALEGHLNEFKGKKVVLIISGGNIDTTVFSRCLERGLAADGRLIKVTVCVTDRPGGVAELVGLMASIGVNIKDVIHERAWVAHDVFSVDVTSVCETRDDMHSKQLRELLKKNYKKVLMEDGQPCRDKSKC